MAVNKKAPAKKKVKAKLKAPPAKAHRFDPPAKPKWERQWKPMEGGVHTEHLTDGQQAAVIDVLRDLMEASKRHEPSCIGNCEDAAECDCRYHGEDMVLHVVGTLGNMRVVHKEAQAMLEKVQKVTGKKVTIRRKTNVKKAAKKAKKA
jgi:hypothetical protein